MLQDVPFVENCEVGKCGWSEEGQDGWLCGKQDLKCSVEIDGLLTFGCLYPRSKVPCRGLHGSSGWFKQVIENENEIESLYGPRLASVANILLPNYIQSYFPPGTIVTYRDPYIDCCKVPEKGGQDRSVSGLELEEREKEREVLRIDCIHIT